jgi:circadian clock protein KaiB
MAITPKRRKRSNGDESAPAGQLLVLRLYIGGASPNSLQANTNILKICDKHLSGRCQLEVVDIYQQPERAALDQIVAVPMLVKRLPQPLRRLFGPLSDSRQVLSAFGPIASSMDPAGNPTNER